MSHVAQKFEAAVRTLVGDGPVKQRLGQAFSKHLADLQDAELPAPMRVAYADLHAAMHRVPPIGKEGSVKVTVQKMSFAEATAHAETIVELYAEVVRTAADRGVLTVVRNEDEPPRYLSGRS